VAAENVDMSTAAEPRRTDLEAICKAIAEGKKVDPEIAKRVREKSDSLRRKIDAISSVEMLRSVRDE
jgi:hypothetical protein